MEIRLDDKAVLVTGASRGIGEAIAAASLEAGAKGVLITSRRSANLDEAKVRLADDRVVSVVAPADDVDAAESAVSACIEAFGSCDILVNNAGTNPAAGPMMTVDLGAVSKTWSVNQLGPLLFARAAWAGWMKDHGGVILNIASVGGLTVGEMLGAYNVSKAAVIHMTRQMAHEMAPNVRVNALAPSVVRTRLAAALWDGIEERTAAAHPLGRIGEPEDVANAALFLMSDAASWITGVTLPVDGGASGAVGNPGLAP